MADFRKWANWGSQFLVRSQERLWWCSLLVMVLVRMSITAYDEIVPIRDDSSNYARYTLYYLDSRAELGLPPQAPGLPMVAAVGRSLGVPYKLWLDGLFVAAAWWVAHTFRGWLNSRVGGLALFASLLFNPWFINHSTLFMSEPLTALLVLLIAVSAAPFAAEPVRRWRIGVALTAGAFSAMYVVIRPELIVAVAFWVLMAIVVALRNWDEVRGLWRGRSTWRLALVGVPLAMMFLSVWTIQRVHWAKYGVPALCASESPALRALLHALYSIRPEEKVRFAPVTYQSLTAACEVCPTLGARRNTLLNRDGSAYASATSRLQLEGEFGTWLNWLLVSAFQGVNPASEQAMLQAVDEIRAAQQSGVLGTRRAMFPIDPLWRLWLPELPSTLYESLTMAISPSFYALSSLDNLQKRRARDFVELGLFDDALLRRQGTAAESTIRISGVFRHAPSRFHEVRFALRGEVVAASPIVMAGDTRQEFTMTIVRSPVRSLNHGKLLFVGQTEQAEIPLKHYMQEERVILVGTPLDEFLNESFARESWIISAASAALDLPLWKQNRRLWVMRWQIIFCASLIAIFCIAIVTPVPRRALVGMRWFLLIAAGWFCGRLLLFSLIEVWLQWGLHRYAETNHLLSILLCAVLAAWSGFELRRLFNRLVLRRRLAPVSAWGE